MDDPYAGLLETPTPGLDVPESPIESTDLACEVCGTPLVYAGRGRKPRFCDEHKANKSTSSNAGRPRGSGDVATALQAMDALYGMMTMALMAISPVAAQQFADNVPAAQIQNQLAFAGDKDLTRTICKGAGKGGKTIFIASQGMLIVPVVRTAMADIASRKPKPPTRTVPTPASSPNPGVQPDGSYVDPVDLNLRRRG